MDIGVLANSDNLSLSKGISTNVQTAEVNSGQEAAKETGDEILLIHFDNKVENENEHDQGASGGSRQLIQMNSRNRKNCGMSTAILLHSFLFPQAY